MEDLKGRIVFLDYMRIVAFGSVLIGHKLFYYLVACATDPTAHATLRAVAGLLIPLCQGGAAGVVLFFLTSGYIITHVLQTESGGIFLIKRIFRIYPLYIFALLLEAILGKAFAGTALPDPWVFLQQALLIGDFFNTPHALAGVEWTLRIEVLFYLYMFMLKSLKVFLRQDLMPFIHLAAAAILYAMPAFPGPELWSVGYMNAYAPFLLIGSVIYLSQRSYVGVGVAAVLISVMLYVSLKATSISQPNWSSSHYAVLALGIFLLSYKCRYRMGFNGVVKVLSDLTYSVYLFHNWLWDYMSQLLAQVGVSGAWSDGVTLLVLLAFCYLAHKSVEHYGVSVGKSFSGVVRPGFKVPG